jgi:chitin synthase
MELLGTVVLPAAIAFTFYVIFSIATVKGSSVLPLLLLACILGVPSVLTVSISGKFQYLFWMLIYLLALPIWNFVLPMYSFWHFDDFSWGETRKTLEDNKDEDHGKKQGEFDGTGISMKTWGEWMEERKAKIETVRIASDNTLNVVDFVF